MAGVGTPPPTPSTVAPAIVSVNVPMPTPNTPNAPFFKGSRVSDFIDSLEQHADHANLSYALLPSYVLRYCHRKVRSVLEGSGVWSTPDWAAAKAHLTDMYGSNDRAPLVSADRLRLWTTKHGELANISSIQDVDRYYREFTQRSTGLLTGGSILQKDLNLCFYRGIPEMLRRAVRKRLPSTGLSVNTPPGITVCLRALRAEFDEEDLDAVVKDVPLYVDDDSDDEGTQDIDQDAIYPERKKKTVTFMLPTEKLVPAAPVVEPPTAPNANDLNRQMQELLQAAARIQRQIETTRPQQTGYAPPAPSNERRCFMCDQTTHRLGLQFCPEVRVLIDEGLVAWTPTGRLAQPDGSDLPRAYNNDGGVARILRSQRASSSNLKGKAREDRDRPPHMANFAGLQFDGEDVMDDDVFGVSAGATVPTWRAFAAPATNSYPAARTQKEDRRHDPTRRPEKRDRDAPENPHMTRARGNVPGPSNAPPPPPPENQHGRPPPTGFDPPPPHITSGRPKQPATSTYGPPPPVNTQEAFKGKKSAAKPRQDVEMADVPKAKTGPAYHFSSDVQEMVDVDALQAKILATNITISLRELLGASVDLSKRFANLCKTKKEYTDKNKTVTAHQVDYHMDAEDYIEDDGFYSTEYQQEDEECYTSYGDAEAGESRVQVEFDSSRDSEDDIFVRYASAVKVHPSRPLFAMVTGRFPGTFGGIQVFFMVDTGSELNLVSRDCYGRTSLPVDLDGTRWSLKGINGTPVPLGGCVRDVPLTVAGHRFDHHFFVSEEGVGNGKQDVILGQPWLQWYTASLNYTREGSMRMNVWQTGETDKKATVSIPLCSPGAQRNADTLDLRSRAREARIEEVDDDQGN